MFKLQPFETKVTAAIAGAISGGVLSKFVLWTVAVLFFGASTSANAASAAVAAVPEPISTLILVVIAATGAGVGGYKAPHTDRPSAGDSSPTVSTVSPSVPVLEQNTVGDSDVLAEADAIFPNAK